MREIYLDNNATTALDPHALELMLPFFKENYGNPNSLHRFGQATHKPLAAAMDKLYDGLGAHELDDVIVTSCATESVNWAIKGVYYDVIKDGTRDEIITSSVEHPAAAAAMLFLEKRCGVKITRLPVDSNGLCSADDLRAAISERTALVNVMWANNETGMIFPIKELAAIAHEHGALFHSDATQAVGKIRVNFRDAGVDYASFSAHKFHGPKGVGGLFIRQGRSLCALLHGGEHMGGRRSGTLNAAGIVGMAEALRQANLMLAFEDSHVRDLRDWLEDELLKISDVFVVGERERRVPNTILAAIKGVEGEAMLWDLNQAGIAASTGSACASETLESNPIMEAIGSAPDLAHTALRLSLSRFNTREEIEIAAAAIKRATERLRAISSTYAYSPKGE